LIILCYLIGSIPFSLIFGLLLGKVDIRTKGSGNIGATNVLRSSGLAVAILALIADMGKGVAGAWIGSAGGGLEMAALCSGAVLLGHCFSVFLKFKGGKAVATSAGVIGFFDAGYTGRFGPDCYRYCICDPLHVSGFDCRSNYAAHSGSIYFLKAFPDCSFKPVYGSSGSLSSSDQYPAADGRN